MRPRRALRALGLSAALWTPLAGPPAFARPPGETKFGIRYHLWHCGDAARDPINMADAEAGRRPWGAAGRFHWWGEPAAGYYCLSRDADVLRRHARRLAEAGIDFVLLDQTLWPYTDSEGFRERMLEPYEALLKTWSAVAGAPKVVPWLPVFGESGKDFQPAWPEVIRSAQRYPGLAFKLRDYDGSEKPLLLVADAGANEGEADRRGACPADS